MNSTGPGPRWGGDAGHSGWTFGCQDLRRHHRTGRGWDLYASQPRAGQDPGHGLARLVVDAGGFGGLDAFGQGVK
jgi:hypothetical protein